MNASMAIAHSRPDARNPLPQAIAFGINLLHAAINAPALIFLAALLAMLFRPPDLRTFPFDRVAFFLLVGVFLLRLCLRRERLQTYGATRPMLALLFLAFLSLLDEPNSAQAWSLFAAKWVVPVVLFHIAGSIFRDRSSLRKLELFSLAVLAYLTLISLLFLFDLKSFIFPRFIGNEGIGIHADRARGPLLQAVANGVCLNVLALVALDCFRRKSLRGLPALLFYLTVPPALLATRTRAVWLSAAVSVALLAFFGSHARLRRPALALAAIAAVLGCALLLDADGNALNERLRDRSPVDFRIDMYRAGWEMFTQKPIAGWGSDASIQPEIARHLGEFRLDSYVFHNTYLELAIQHGIIAIGLYAWLLGCLVRLAKTHSAGFTEPHFMDAHFRRLWPIILVVYLINASAVVMNYQFVNGFVFTLVGILAAQNENEMHALGELARTR